MRRHRDTSWGRESSPQSSQSWGPLASLPQGPLRDQEDVGWSCVSPNSLQALLSGSGAEQRPVRLQ